MKSSFFTSLPPVAKTGLDWEARNEVVPIAEFPRGCPVRGPRGVFRWSSYKEESGTRFRGRRFYVLIVQRKWRKSFAGLEEPAVCRTTLGRSHRCVIATTLGCKSRLSRTTAEDDSNPECGSEKSLEVSSASLASSVISRVARLHNSNPTNVTRMSLARISKPDRKGHIYNICPANHYYR